MRELSEDERPQKISSVIQNINIIPHTIAGINTFVIKFKFVINFDICYARICKLIGAIPKAIGG